MNLLEPRGPDELVLCVVLTLVTVFTNTSCKPEAFAKQADPSPPVCSVRTVTRFPTYKSHNSTTEAKTEGATANVGTIPIL